jgi:O-antigen/teichoic acid export membrane protein
MCILGIPFLAVMLLFPIFMMGLFGSDFKAGAPLLQILAAGQFLSIITGSASYMLIMSDNEKDMRNALLLIAPLNIFITISLTKEFGAIGCAISTAAAISAQNIFAAYKAKKRLGINSLRII